ncbi:MAG: O-methyltransferase [Prevotellaceae bacterium]|jgi:predicted O-methyltransferase YrrM|nr:O-methyltransferase [Prevotellaceae bacterium]
MSLEEYILSHIDKEPDYLSVLERKTYTRFINPRMVSGHFQGRLLKMLTTMIAPKNILEIGTFTGYSALCFAEGLEDSGHIHTIEIDDELEDVIRENLAQSPYNEKITLHIGNALDIIPKLDTVFDMVFLDADKRLYLDFYRVALPKVRKGGFIIADNTLWGEKILHPTQSGDNQTKKLIDFNNFIASDNRIEKIILPIRDGLTVMRKMQ